MESMHSKMQKAKLTANDDNIEELTPETERQAYYRGRRKAAIALFGDCCVICGSKSRLQIDHKQAISMSTEKRDKLRERGISLYLDLIAGKRNKEDFQLLCKDCHTEKTVNNGEYMNPVKRALLHPEFDDE